MQNIAMKLKTKQEQLSNENGIFRNEAGAIDLASIMVGVIVVGLIGGVVAATVFAVIPWAQDNGAKEQLDSVVAAQSAYMGLSSSVPPAVPAGHAANSYASSEQLEEAGLLKRGPKHCSISTDTGKGYTVFTKSDSGKVWTASNKNTKPEIYTGNLPTECQFLGAGANSADDTDGDGIPNASDRDADGDGIQDGYVPGGPIAALDGTSYPTSGTYYSTLLTNGGTTILSNASNAGVNATRKISMQYIVTCLKDDGSFYKKNMLNGFTANANTANNTNFLLTPCAAGERIDEYIVKPVTQEAMASGEIENPEYFGGYTFIYQNAPGGVRWSEPDGYPTSGKFVSSYLAGGGSTIYATYQNANGTSTKSATQYTAMCERADKTTYKVNKLGSYTSRAGYIENTVMALTPCGSDRIIAYDIFPVNKLGDVSATDRALMGAYGMSGTKSWTESDGYPTAGSFQSAYLAGGGSTIYATVQNGSGTSYSMSFQYITTCERPDKSTYSTNKMASYTSRAGYIENTVFGLTPCGTDRVIVYEISALKKLGDVDSRTNFGGYTITGGKTWTEADGYPTSGSFQSAYLAGGGSTIYATVQNGSGTATPLAFQYTATCERADKTTYSTNKLANYTSRAGVIENTVFGLTPCNSDRVTAYEIFPVKALGDADNRTIFGGYTMTGSKSWNETRDGYLMSGNYVSSNITGTTLYAKFRNENGTSTTLSTNYTMTCEKTDGSTYSVNKIATYTSRALTIEDTTFGFTDCGTDKIKAYTIAPVTKLGDVTNRTAFQGYSLKGSYSWAG